MPWKYLVERSLLGQGTVAKATYLLSPTKAKHFLISCNPIISLVLSNAYWTFSEEILLRANETLYIQQQESMPARER